jgi:hypothetical protein
MAWINADKRRKEIWLVYCLKKAHAGGYSIIGGLKIREGFGDYGR